MKTERLNPQKLSLLGFKSALSKDVAYCSEVSIWGYFLSKNSCLQLSLLEEFASSITLGTSELGVTPFESPSLSAKFSTSKGLREDT